MQKKKWFAFAVVILLACCADGFSQVKDTTQESQTVVTDTATADSLKVRFLLGYGNALGFRFGTDIPLSHYFSLQPAVGIFFIFFGPVDSYLGGTYIHFSISGIHQGVHLFDQLFLFPSVAVSYNIGGKLKTTETTALMGLANIGFRIGRVSKTHFSVQLGVGYFHTLTRPPGDSYIKSFGPNVDLSVVF